MSEKQKKERRKQEYTPLIKLLEGHYFDKKAHEGAIPCSPNEPKQSLKETWRTLCTFPVYRFPKAKGRQHQVCMSNETFASEGVSDIKNFLLPFMAAIFIDAISVRISF